MICERVCGFIKHGFYSRGKIKSDGSQAIIRIQRYFCKIKRRTFSYLPEELIPYRVFSLGIIFELLRIMFDSVGQSQQQQLAKIVYKYDKKPVVNICFAQLEKMKTLLNCAMNKYTFLTGKHFDTLPDFFEYCQGYKFNNHTGYLAIKQSIYCQSKDFLFGTASQFR